MKVRVHIAEDAEVSEPLRECLLSSAPVPSGTSRLSRFVLRGGGGGARR